MLSGCGLIGEAGGGSAQPPPQSSNTGQQSNQQASQDESSDTSQDADEIFHVVLPEILLPVASGAAVEENEQAIIDYSNSRDGYIMVRYTENSDVLIKLLIIGPDGVQYQYKLEPAGDFVAFPLSSGNGSYEIGVFMQVDADRYAMVLSTTIDVTLTDEFAPFLRPNQFVNFNQDSEAVRKAAELTARTDVFMEKVAAIYQFIITNIDYDTEFANTVQQGNAPNYVPDIDRVLSRKMGICFDYASLMTAMLRSQGIPTKLVIGYAGEIRHAWISVYSKEEGWLDDVIFFDGNEWHFADPTFAASGSSQEIARFIGDGSNYTVTHVH